MLEGESRQGASGEIARSLRSFLISVVVAVGVAGMAAAAMLYWEITSSLPPLTGIVENRPPVTTQVFAADGALIGEFFSERRYLVDAERIPLHVRQAFIAAEDQAFYRHRGVDFLSVIRALFNNLVAGKKIQGGSTITQQVVKSLLLTPQKSYERKIKEVILAIRLERQVPKDEILSLYLNHIYLGSGAYGVAAAAQGYFGKDVQDLSLAEAAMLAGLPKAPSHYSPFHNWPRAKARQSYVLNRMYDSGFITRRDYERALREPLALAPRRGNFLAAPYFLEHVRQLLEERYGRTVAYDLGLRVHTTLDLDMQGAAENALRKGIDEITARHGGYRNAFRDMTPEERESYLWHQRVLLRREPLNPSRSYEAIVTALREGSARVQVGPIVGDLVEGPNDTSKIEDLELNDLVRVRFVSDEEERPQFVLDPSLPVEGAFVALDPVMGHIKAMVGGYDFSRSQFNRVTQARRQPGSAFKPLVYAAALDRHFTPASVIVDEPIFFWDNGKLWKPKNFEDKHFGRTSLRSALTFSRNVVTIRVAQRIGIKYLVEYLQRFRMRGPFRRNLSIALGSAEVTPLELAAAYATFANSGMRAEPQSITKITDSNGNVLEVFPPVVEEAIPATTAYQITSMLQDAVSRGTGRRASGLPHPTAGKTGTTNDFRDAWFVGYIPQLLAAVWVGFDSEQSLGDKETGGRVAAPIWKAFMEEATKNMPPERFTVPDGLTCVNIHPVTGRLVVPGGPFRLECFRTGTEPTLQAQPQIQAVTQEDDRPGSALDFLRHDF
jgi:penicillin-binding protein 1A